jgi:ligand-binding sensor domain-containing protein/signal transduction histidine kinase
MRRTSIIRVIVVLAAPPLLVSMVLRSEQSRLATKRAQTSQVAGDHANELHSNAEQSLPERASPPKPSFSHLSVADGLSDGDVRAITQDKQGFMWFGTWLGGLNRYDGYTFKVYRHDGKDERSLACDTIRALFVDRAGVLWVGTSEGLDRYDRDTDSFVHYRHRADDPNSLPGYEVRSLSEDASGTLWVATSGGLSRFDRTSGRFFTFKPNPNDQSAFGDDDILSACLDAATGLLWVTAWHQGARALDPATSHFTAYKNDPDDPASLSNSDLLHIYQDRKGNLWFSTLRGLNRFDPTTHTFIRYLHDPGNSASLTDDNVWMTYEDRAGRFWVATNNGLNLMDRDHGTFTRFPHNPNDSSSPSGNVINWRAMYEDGSGALWLGMRSTGVDRLAVGAARFTTYRHVSQDPKSLSNNVVTGIAMGPANTLWIGTEAGLDRFDGQRFTHYAAGSTDPGALSPGPQREVAADSHGVVWTGTYGGGLDRLDGQHVTHFRHDPRNHDTLAINNISSLVSDDHGGVWIGVHGDGLDYFDGRHFTHFPPKPGNPSGLQDGWVLPLVLDPHGMLWVATSNWGLVRFDTHARKFTTYLIDPSQPGNQVANWTQDVCFDGGGIWVVSPTTGLFRFDPGTGKFTHHYTEKDGLPNNAVLGVLKDNQGNVWVSTVKGLSRFDPKTETFRNYDRFDGLQGNEFSLNSRAKAPDGRLFFGGTDGLSVFYPDELVQNPTPPPVVLTEFDLFNRPVAIGAKDSPLRQAIHAASSITLRYDQSVFRFQFAALDFTAPQKNRYAYKLDDFDRDWQYTDATRRFATYTHLDPGDYTFRVKASNNDGVWNEQGVALHLRILPPWWNTWWFRALSVGAFVLLMWALHQLRLQGLQRQFNMTLEARVGERTRIARELHDTLLQSFQGLMLRFQTVDEMLPGRPADAKKSLECALERGDQAISEGRDAITDIRASAMASQDLAKSITALMANFVEELSEGKGASVAFQVLVEGTPRIVRPNIQSEIYRIARESLGNAFRHAQARLIETEITYSESLRLRFRDDGIGIDSSVIEHGGRPRHWGLLGIRERAQQIGAQLEIWSELGAGTEIELSVPGSIAYEVFTTKGSFRIFPKRMEQDNEHRS